MASDLEPTFLNHAAKPAAWSPYRLTVKQLLAMIDAGIFPHDTDLELINGILVERAVKGNPHDFTLDAIAEALRRLTPVGWSLREDKSLQLGPRSRLEPDVAIVRGTRRQYDKRTPGARDTALIVEVAGSSYLYDRGEKWRAYASARIPIYWIVNLDLRQIEVDTDPTGKGRAALYRKTQTCAADVEVAVVLDGQGVGRIVVKDILP